MLPSVVARCRGVACALELCCSVTGAELRGLDWLFAVCSLYDEYHAFAFAFGFVPVAF